MNPKLCVNLPSFIKGWFFTANHKPEKTPSPSPSPPSKEEGQADSGER